MSTTAIHGRPWVLVLGATLTYDAWLISRRHDSLSHHFARTARRRPVALSLGVGYLLAHLYGVLPGRGDAFQFLFRRLSQEPSGDRTA